MATLVQFRLRLKLNKKYDRNLIMYILEDKSASD
jgi:hypothetical protein